MIVSKLQPTNVCSAATFVKRVIEPHNQNGGTKSENKEKQERFNKQSLVSHRNSHVLVKARGMVVLLHCHR